MDLSRRERLLHRLRNLGSYRSRTNLLSWRHIRQVALVFLDWVLVADCNISVGEEMAEEFLPVSFEIGVLSVRAI